MRARFGTRTFVARASAAACRRAMARRFVTFAKYLLERFQISRLRAWKQNIGRNRGDINPGSGVNPVSFPALTLAPVFFPGHLDRYFFNEKIGQVFVFIGTTISQRAVLRPSIDRGFRFPVKFSFAPSLHLQIGAAKKKITAAVPIWNTRPFRERKKKALDRAASVELTVMTAFAVSPEPRSRVFEDFSLPAKATTHGRVRRARVEVSRARPAQATMESRRDPLAETSEVSDDTVRAGAVSGETGTGASRAPPSSRQRIIPLGRTRADSRPRPSRADTPPPRERPQVIRDPFEKPLPTRDELPYWSMREVLPELLETEETAVRPRAIVRPAPRTARSGHSQPFATALGSVPGAPRDENLASGVFPEPRARRNARRPRDEAMKRPRTS